MNALLSLGGMNASNPQPTNPFQQALYSVAKSISNALDPAPPPGTPSVGTPDPNTGAVAGTLGFPTGSGLTYNASPATKGSITLSSDGTFTYTPSQSARQEATANSTDSFVVTAHYGLSTSSVTITVPIDPGTPVAGAPVHLAPNANTGVVTGFTMFHDTAGRTLTYTTTGFSTGGGSVIIDTAGSFIYTPTQAQRQAAGLNASDTFTVTATNGIRTATQIITVPIDSWSPIAGTPIVGIPSTASGAVNGRAKFTDAAGRTLTYSVSGFSTGGGTVTVNPTGAFIYTPTRQQRQVAGPSTTDTFTITATNNVGGTSTQTITVAVDPGTPVALHSSVDTYVGASGAVNGSVTFNDTAGRTLTYSTTGSSTGGGTVSIDSSTGSFIYTPTQAQRSGTATTDTFTVTASNGVRTATQTVIVQVLSSAIVATIPVGHEPGSLAVSPNGANLYVVNTSDKTVSVINTATKAVIATIGLITTPFEIAMAANGFAYVTSVSNPAITVIDTATNTVKATIPVSTTYGLAIDPNSGLAYAVRRNANSVAVINTATNKITSQISVNQPIAVALSPDGTRLYVATSEATALGVSVINAATGSVVATIPSAYTASLAVSPDGSQVYVTNTVTGTGEASQAGNTVSVINTATNAVTATITVGNYPTDVTFSPDGNFAYVTNRGDGTVSVIDTATQTVNKTMYVGIEPYSVAVSSDGRTAYVADVIGNAVTVIDLSALTAPSE